MKALKQIGVLASSFLSFAGICYGATIAGTVKGPDGGPFRGAFVEAQSKATHITVDVLSNKDGHYEISDLGPGQYDLRIRAVGFVADPRSGISLTAKQNSSVDFALQKGTVHWNDISPYQGSQLFPENAAKKYLFDNKMCMQCHAFETRMASVVRDEDGWKDRVNYMRQVMGWTLANKLNDQVVDDLSSYLASLFGPNSILPKSPEEMPQYKNLVQKYTDDAMNIVYVEYDMPGPSSMPFSAAPDKDGVVWIPMNGVANRIGRLDPKTGVVQEFVVPNQGTAEVHSAVEAADGAVWIAEQAVNKVAKWDPKTHEITEYRDTDQTPNGGGSKHTLAIGPLGDVWATGGPSVSRFDPETHKFSHYDVKGSYGLVFDKDGNCWVADWFRPDGKISKIDAKTGKITDYSPPSANDGPRRIAIDSQGIVWFGDNTGGRIGRFDPKTEAFKEYPLPGARPSPYGFGIGKDDVLWYSSEYMDVIGRMDPKTGQVTEYPFPHSEVTIRDFFTDSQGRIWYGSPSNNKVGYFYLAKR